MTLSTHTSTISARYGIQAYCWCAACILGAYSVTAPAQVASVPSSQSKPVHLARTRPATGANEKPIAALSQHPGAASADKPANAALVILKDGTLSVEANNSDLSQILSALSDASGMKVAGQSFTYRVYGTYGPSAPRDVLTELLTGSGYNFVMTGVTPNGAPHELLLSPEKTRSTDVPHAAAPPNAVDTSAAPTQEGEHLGPGAIAHPPPPPSEDPQERTRQNMQRLEQMHQKLGQANTPQ